MSKLNPTDIQGFVLRGYNMPVARYLFLHLADAAHARTFIDRLIPHITTGQLWDNGKPPSTVNIAFTYAGLAAFELPLATLISFPVEFQQGMKQRAAILGDTNKNAPDRWDPVWHTDRIHVWLAVNAQTPTDLESRCADLTTLITTNGGVTILAQQDAAYNPIPADPNASLNTKEHFGYTDGFGNPDYLNVERKTQPGQGKLNPDGTWSPLATGELLLGYADEAGELPVAPIPHLFAANGTFMVYRKLHQNVATFRTYLDEQTAHYAAGDTAAKEKLAAKFIGRWRDGTPIELSPDAPNYPLTQDPNRSTNFTYAKDPEGTGCPLSAHIRRVNPRDAFGFEGRLIHRRRITRRGLPYGTFIPEDQPTSQINDTEDRGVVFMALNASLSRQFEFIQQQWIEYGNDARQGNDKDVLMGNHDGCGRFHVQGDRTPSNPPLTCTHLPNFVELRGGDYFFLPSITALGMLAKDLVDPR